MEAPKRSAKQDESVCRARKRLCFDPINPAMFGFGAEIPHKVLHQNTLLLESKDCPAGSFYRYADFVPDCLVLSEQHSRKVQSLREKIKMHSVMLRDLQSKRNHYRKLIKDDLADPLEKRYHQLSLVNLQADLRKLETEKIVLDNEIDNLSLPEQYDFVDSIRTTNRTLDVLKNMHPHVDPEQWKNQVDGCALTRFFRNLRADLISANIFVEHYLCAERPFYGLKRRHIFELSLVDEEQIKEDIFDPILSHIVLQSIQTSMSDLVFPPKSKSDSDAEIFFDLRSVSEQTEPEKQRSVVRSIKHIIVALSDKLNLKSWVILDDPANLSDLANEELQSFLSALEGMVVYQRSMKSPAQFPRIWNYYLDSLRKIQFIGSKDDFDQWIQDLDSIGFLDCKRMLLCVDANLD